MSFVPRIGTALALCGALCSVAWSGCARGPLQPSEDASDGGTGLPAPDDGGSPFQDGGSSSDSGNIAPVDSGRPDAAISQDSGPIFVTDGGSQPRDSGVEVDSGSAPDASSEDAGSGNLDAGPMFVCTATNTCQTARALNQIRGDVDAQVSSASGIMSEWLKITILDVGGVFNTDATLKARITLTSPVGSNYDLFVHRPDDAGGNAIAPKDCSVAPISAQQTSGDDVVSLSWADVTNFFGETAGDGLVLSIEVRHVSGPCDKPWSLSVQGNAL